jgi:DNA-binding Xre family transcriptional regulator
MTAARKNPHLGAKFEDFLAEDDILQAANLVATKRVLAWRIAELMKKQRVTKTVLAKRMKTSRAALDRLLDDENTAVTLQTMGRAAAVLGQELTITLRRAA